MDLCFFLTQLCNYVTLLQKKKLDFFKLLFQSSRDGMYGYDSQRKWHDQEGDIFIFPHGRLKSVFLFFFSQNWFLFFLKLECDYCMAILDISSLVLSSF